ncbi:MAG: hypothetical protein KA385_01975 [Vicinamibacteria bacterium]|nr:hypothetical protein [Vicinamibacteria bacterium]
MFNPRRFLSGIRATVRRFYGLLAVSLVVTVPVGHFGQARVKQANDPPRDRCEQFCEIEMGLEILKRRREAPVLGRDGPEYAAWAVPHPRQAHRVPRESVVAAG